MTYNEIKGKYKEFIFDKVDITESNDSYKITYYFEIVGLSKFNPTLTIFKSNISNNNIDMNLFKQLAFEIGMVELVSYWKIAMPYNVKVNAGYLSESDIKFYKKLYFYGLGEFLYTNHIDINEDELMEITSYGIKLDYSKEFTSKGNMITIGGGKDSVVALNVLKGLDNVSFIINPKEVQLECSAIAGLKTLSVERTLDENMIRLNKEGYLNGHTPFSALVSFITYLMAYLNNKKYIVLSNESSANEANVRGTKVNHQYSKSFEYENDFNNYVTNKYGLDIHYFSLLRPLYEIQIAELFSKYKEYHKVFKSCNKGSKQNPWVWCCNCSKCLFVYIMLSAFLSDDELVNIFGENLYEKESLLDTFKDLLGITDNKPFDCVGTYEEVNFAIQKRIEKGGNLPYLLKYYKENINIEVRKDLLDHFDEKNNVPEEFINILKGEINHE